MENIVNSFNSLYKAYRKTRCGKRDNPTAMRYRMEAIERTADLSDRLQRREYTFGPYYPFKVFVTEDANLQPNDYVDIQYQKDTSAEESGSSLYLESMFIRTDNGKSYVMARGEDGRLEQRWVQTGRDLWGSYTQIRGGLTIDDYVAFPYGRDVVEGAHTQEATADQLYNYGI